MTSSKYVQQLQTWWPPVLDIIKKEDWCTGCKLPDGRIKFHVGCNERLARRLQQPLDPREASAFNRIRCDAFRSDGNSLYQHLADLCSWDPEVVAAAQTRAWCQACRSKVALNYLPRFFSARAGPGSGASAVLGGRRRGDYSRVHYISAPTHVARRCHTDLFREVPLYDVSQKADLP
jgi:hypothetical protein